MKMGKYCLAALQRFRVMMMGINGIDSLAREEFHSNPSLRQSVVLVVTASDFQIRSKVIPAMRTRTVVVRRRLSSTK